MGGSHGNGPSTILRKYCSPGTSRYINQSRPVKRTEELDNEVPVDAPEIVYHLQRIQSPVSTHCTVTSAFLRWFVIAFLLLITIPIASSTPDESGSPAATNIITGVGVAVVAAAEVFIGVAGIDNDEDHEGQVAQDDNDEEHGGQVAQEDMPAAGPTPPPPSKRKPPKKKKGQHYRRKKTRYNHAAAKAAMGLPNSAPPNQLTSAIMAQRDGRAGPKQRSPLKEAVKQQNKKLLQLDEQRCRELEELRELSLAARAKIDEQEADLEQQEEQLQDLSSDNRDLQKKNKQLNSLKQKRASDRKLLKEHAKTIGSLEEEKEELAALKKEDTQELASLKKEDTQKSKIIVKLLDSNNKYAQLLRDEKAASRAVISKVMEDAEAMMDEAQMIRKASKKKEKEIQQAEKEEVWEERRWSARAAKKGKRLTCH